MDDSRSRWLRRISTVVGVIGAALILVGAAGLALDGGDDTGGSSSEERVSGDTPRAAPTPTRSTGPATTTTTVSARSQVDAFFSEWATALRNGDSTFLVARLHPAVVDRYSEATCRASLSTLRFPAATTQVLSVDAATAPWPWETDGRSTAIPDAIGLQLRRTEDGTNFTEGPAHVAFVNGEVRWFTDCGAPKES